MDLDHGFDSEAVDWLVDAAADNLDGSSAVAVDCVRV